MGLRKNLRDKYSPTLFLASLGNGGMTVAFYVYLHFMLKHMKIAVEGHDNPLNIPMVEFGAVKQALTSGDLATSIFVGIALLGILVFAIRHYFYLFWNISEFKTYQKTAAYQDLINSPQEISLAAIPLTLAMSINVMFVCAAIFTPGLWGFVEYLFPAALLGFLLVGIYALKIVGVFMTRVLTSGDFDCSNNNSLAMMISVFAFSMVAVGFAAPGAMSNTLVTSAIGIIGSTFFLSLTVLLGLMTLFMGFRSMMQNGINKENSPTLWILIPILTLVGISVVRVDHGLHMNLGVHTQKGEMFVNLIFLTSLQVVFGLMGWFVMKQVGYFKEYINGPGQSHVSYALVCPGVAGFVFGMFTLHMGLVRMAVVPKFGIAYWILLAGLVFIQLKTILMIFKLDRKLLMK
ncbi:MAG: hypothetical protein GY780_07380 [bacterium]|nr:hypothetical protein [bacterium]